VDERRRRQVERGRAATLLLPLVTLPLIEVSPLRRGDKLLRRAGVIGVVRLIVTGDGDERAVMEIIVPQRVHAVPSRSIGRTSCVFCGSFSLMR
jgi:hypothetical protein